MATQMECLEGLDVDDKDGHADMNVFTLLQGPRRKEQESSCNSSFEKGVLKRNSSLDVLSNSAILSPIGLGNGPSSQNNPETQELEGISNDREEEKNMTQLKTVQDIDTAGLWDFQAESPENSLDNGNLKWDHHKDFMHFVWNNQSNSPDEEPKDTQLTDHQRKRKRKMDMVVMVDPTEDLYSKDPSGYSYEGEHQQESVLIAREKNSLPLPTEKPRKHPNGTIKVKNPPKFQIPSFVCKVCGQAFRKSSSLIEHMSVHKEKSRASDERKIRTDKKDTNTVDSLCMEESFSCNLCSYRTFSKNVFHNHIILRHDISFEKYEADHPPVKSPVPKRQIRSPMQDAEFTSKLIYKHMTSEKASPPKESNEIADLFKNSNNKRVKSQLVHSKLDRSIDILLSKQRDGKKSQEVIKPKNNDRISGMEYAKKEMDHLSKTITIEAGDTKLDRNNHVIFTSTNRSSPKTNHDLSIIRKSSSKRKMSKPYRNTPDMCLALPNHVDTENGDETDVFHFEDEDEDGEIFENGMKKSDQNILYSFSRRMSMRGALQASKRLFEKQQEDNFEIKEECIESEVFPETFEPHTIPLGESFEDDMSDVDIDGKTCPYCPAVFESGVGLSNHIRGHLHRVGVHYNARHEVSPEQVACHDRRPRVRRRISKAKQQKRAAQLESGVDPLQNIHSCPLCGDSFDNRTGQANHIRGHLKKLGRRFMSKSKSPVVLLQELMEDKKEFQRAVQLLGKKRNHYRYDHFFTSTPAVSAVSTDATPAPPLSFPFLKTDNKEVQAKDAKDSMSSNNALIGILKKRKCLEESKMKVSSPMCKNLQPFPSSTDHCPGSRYASSMPNSVCEKGEFNRKVCVHCNASFHSGVSLSNHLRAYAKRKRNALQEGTTFDCKIRKQRSRPGSKKKTFALPQTPEEMYRLTCRFCDLVFQGPLSVQEDWIKHLQRHIMNTSVPYTGLGMVDVPPLDPPSVQTDQDGSRTASDATL